MKDSSDSSKPKEAAAPAGRRADDSSLFSLESLKIKETATAAQARKTNEDSGLIDLRALAALERQGDNQRSPLDVASVVAPHDIFGASPGTPLMAPPPASAMAAAPIGMTAEAPKKNTGIIVGGAVIAVAAAVGIFMLTRGSAPAATTPATTAAPAVTQAAQPAEPASPEPSVAAVVPGQRPAPTAVATAADTAVAAPPKPVVKGPMPKAPPKETAAPAPPPKPVDTCDLACQMQRAVNKKK